MGEGAVTEETPQYTVPPTNRSDTSISVDTTRLVLDTVFRRTRALTTRGTPDKEGVDDGTHDGAFVSPGCVGLGVGDSVGVTVGLSVGQ
jgi:hypothetical protein